MSDINKSKILSENYNIKEINGNFSKINYYENGEKTIETDSNNKNIANNINNLENTNLISKN